jgi:4-amino-4-deoxy-L-arabinose transferase-like glycosyltransferase
MSTRAVLALLALLCALLFMGRLGATSLWDTDEADYARAAVEMRESGDLVVPTINGRLLADKPPLHYWIMIAAYRLFGEGEFAARIGAVVFGAATVLMTGAVGCAWYGAAGGLVAGLSLATSLLFSFCARSATTDVFLVFFTAAAALAAFAARERPRFALLAWGAAGLAVLAKGPVGLLLPAGAVIITALLRGEAGARRGSWLRNLLSPWAVLLFLLLVLPWYLLAAARTGGALIGGFLLTHNLERFLTPLQSHRGPLLYYLPIVLLGFFPFAAILPQAAAAALVGAAPQAPQAGEGPAASGAGAGTEGGPRNSLLLWVRRLPAAARAGDPRGLFLLVWASLVVLFFSLAGTKLPTYVLPAFPALALMTGALGTALAAGARPRGMTASWTANLLLALAFAAGVRLGLSYAAPALADWALWMGAAALLAALLPLAAHLAPRPLRSGSGPRGGRCRRERSPLEPLLLASAGGALFVAVLHQVAAPGFESARTAPVLGRIIRATAGPDEEAACLGYYRPSLVFYAGRRMERLRTPEQLAAFLDRDQGRYLVTTGEEWDRLPRPVKARLMPVWAGPDFPDSPRTVMLAVNGWGRGPGRAIPPGGP